MSLEERIKAIIHQQGPIPFADFMRLALYDPAEGYYAVPHDQIGPEGDFYTSPATHPAFGALLAVQLYAMWLSLSRPEPFTIVEFAAGSGLLCRDILSYSRRLSSAFHRAIVYQPVDIQGIGTLPPLARRFRVRVRPTVSPDEALSLHRLTGCILSNELLDAMPAHRVLRQSGELKEVYAGLGDDKLVDVVGEPSTPLLEERLRKVGADLQEGCQGEVCLEAANWLRRAAQVLERGYILTIDYGDLAPDLYSPRRRRGTLLCYYRHRLSEDPYQRIGQQDITAHVDFIALVQAGEGYGLQPLVLATQRELLLRLGLDLFLDALARRGLRQRDYYANSLAMRDLIQPDGLGSFKVLIQWKGKDNSELAEAVAHCRHRLEERHRQGRLNPLLLTRAHMPLLQARYPHLAQF